MKLELKHLAPYLPYKLNWNTLNGNLWTKETMIGVTKDVVIFSISEDNDLESSFDLNYIGDGAMKPILKPLSDLNVSKSLFGEYNWDYPEEFINSISGGCVEYIYMIELFKQHYDIFGLIEKGLAIDIKTLKQ